MVTLVFAELVARLLLPMSDEMQVEAAVAARQSIALMQPCIRERRLPAGGAQESSEATPAPREQPGLLRVVVVGESSGEMLADEMQETLPWLQIDGRVELLNCASAGSGLEHVQLRAQEALSHQPDVLIVVFGHNLELRYQTSTIAVHLLDWFPWSWLATAVARSVSALVEGNQVQEERLSKFAGWLADLTPQATRDGRRLVLVTVTPNYWMPPVAHGYPEQPEILAAKYEYASGSRQAAVARLERLANAEASPQSSFVLARWLAREGRTEESNRWLERALEGDAGIPGTLIKRERARMDVNRVIREAARRPGVSLHDSEARMRSIAKFGLPGWDLMRDKCHLSEDQQKREALAVWLEVLSIPGIDSRIAAITSALGVGETSSDAVVTSLLQSPPPEAIAAEVASTAVEQWLRIGVKPQATLRLLTESLLAGDALQKSKPRDMCLLLTGVADGVWSTGERADARIFNRAARQLGCAESWTQLGLFQIADGDNAAAVTAFDEALRIAPRAMDARFYKEATIAAGSTSTAGSRPPATPHRSSATKK